MSKYRHYVVVVLSVCIYGSYQLIPLPDYIHPCSELSDECFTQATLDAIPGIVKGIPEAEIPPLDPLYLERNISMVLPGNLKMTFHNAKLQGLSTCIPDKVSSRRKKRTFVFDMHCNFTVSGQYSLLGRLLLFNLDTEGQAKIKIYNQRIRLEVVERVLLNDKGEGHYKINSYKYKADYGTDLKLNLTNLIRGNPQFSANVLQVLNADSQALANDFGGPILDYAIDYAMNVTQKFFNAYTYDQISHVPLTEDFFEKEQNNANYFSMLALCPYVAVSGCPLKISAVLWCCTTTQHYAEWTPSCHSHCVQPIQCK